jgi:diaminohydroxyphosphoribosylaminopyrimidine deaminase / 5-amino-6-(5-phosphoribosylamino)uracil reductase
MMIRREACTDDDLRWMRRAVDIGRMSAAEVGRSDVPRVGVVLACGSELLSEAHRGETGPGDHAEYGLLNRLADGDLREATLYTTLEPCSRRSPEKTPCAQRIIDHGVGTVAIGMYDPNPMIYREGWRMLRDARVRLRDFDASLRAEVRSDNFSFVQHFQRAVGLDGAASFDYEQNGGFFDLLADESSEVTFRTKWVRRGPRTIYIYDSDNHVALARYASEFNEVDDPGALDFSNYTMPVDEGEVAVFRNSRGYALVRVDRVLAGPTWGDDRTEVQFRFELRMD